MAMICMCMIILGLVSLVLSLRERDYFAIFSLLAKLVTAAAMFQAFRFFKWDVAKGLLGGVLFCLMYQDAHLALAGLWAEENYDAYLTAGVQGSLVLAGAAMNLLMTVMITANHFFINYAAHGNLKNVIFNRIALVFKSAVCVLLVAANSQLGFSSVLRWEHSLQYLMDIALLLLVACMEAQLDYFNQMRYELKMQKTKRKAERKAEVDK